MKERKESFYARNMELIDALMPIFVIGTFVLVLTPVIFFAYTHSQKCENIAEKMYDYEDIYCDTHTGDNICKCVMYKYQDISEDIKEDWTIHKTFEIKN